MQKICNSRRHQQLESILCDLGGGEPSRIKTDVRECETDRGEVDREGEDDEGHDPEHGLHGFQVGVVDTGLCPQLKKRRSDNERIIKEKLDYIKRLPRPLNWAKAGEPPG